MKFLFWFLVRRFEQLRGGQTNRPTSNCSKIPLKRRRWDSTGVTVSLSLARLNPSNPSTRKLARFRFSTEIKKRKQKLPFLFRRRWDSTGVTVSLSLARLNPSNPSTRKLARFRFSTEIKKRKQKLPFLFRRRWDSTGVTVSLSLARLNPSNPSTRKLARFRFSTEIKKRKQKLPFLFRRRWDSNPRYGVSAHTLSKRAPSATRTLLQRPKRLVQNGFWHNKKLASVSAKLK